MSYHYRYICIMWFATSNTAKNNYTNIWLQPRMDVNVYRHRGVQAANRNIAANDLEPVPFIKLYAEDKTISLVLNNYFQVN